MKHPFPDPEHLHCNAEQMLCEGFTNPFRYVPHPLVKEAAERVLSILESWRKEPDGSSLREVESSFAEGKMLGVLVCRKMEHQDDNTLCYLSAFSGTVRGADGRVTATVDGFVPPIIDLTEENGYFKRKEAEISHINQRISELSSAIRLRDLKDSYQSMLAQQKIEICAMQEQLRLSKIRREEIRKSNSDAALEADLIKESQFQKAQLKRLKDKWKGALAETGAQVCALETEISELKKERSARSDELQKWIFENALINNGLGEVSSIWNVFACSGLVPPGGTGDCAAPKLLEYAYRNGLQPLAMGEFWYGRSPETAVRTHGHFYPSCTSKCGPLLGYMMQGLRLHDISHDNYTTVQNPIIIHEDEDIIVVEKPSGMPSVPGLDGRISLQEWLSERAESISAAQQNAPLDDITLAGYHSKSEVHSVHRLDMDTSGVMVYAKTETAALHLRKQFEEHTIRKTYMARISPPHMESQMSRDSEMHQSNSIDLPLSPDYDERPRQKVDFKQGKPAHTDYKILQTNPDGTTDILLYPLTGRTHQLRVHCAHTLGLGRPILGDLLYGAHTVHLPTQTSASRSPIEHLSGTKQADHSPIPQQAVYSPAPRQADLSSAKSEPTPSNTTSISKISNRDRSSRLCLHALSITFTHPLTGTPQTFTSDRMSF